MRVVATQYSAEHRALEIYLSGCDGDCRGCHNPELWSFDVGQDYISCLPSIISKINTFTLLIDNIWILGGEPLLQDKQSFIDFISKIKKTQKTMWLFTRFEEEDVSYQITKMFDYIKFGKYQQELATDSNLQYGVKLSTSNQYIKFVGGALAT